MTAAAELDLSEFEGKRVIVTYNEGAEGLELEGTVQSGNSLGLLIKPKGKSSVEIIEASSIEQVVAAPEKPKVFNVRYLKEIKFGEARKHLLDRHGMTLTSINSISEEAAFAQHNSIDHLASDLGHTHGEKPKASANTEAEAVETGSDDVDDDD